MVVALETAVPVVDIGGAVFLVVLATSLTLGGIALAVMVVDTLTQVLLVELETEVVLVDFSIVAVGSCRVVARLGAVGRVVLAQLLGLRGSHMQMGASLDDLEGLLETLGHLEYRGKVSRRRSKDALAIVVEDKVGVEVARSDQ